MWTETKIEILLKEKLNELSASILHHDKFWTQYESVRGYMCREIYPNIANTEPNLTDHGETHIQNVLINAYKLISNNNEYTPLDLYVLCSAILIHDIGNIHGRRGHEQTLTRAYNENPVFSAVDVAEKLIISKIATSHGGKEEAILDLSDSNNISGERIQSKCIAGLVRFADELAEGPQRTSEYMIDQKLISDDSLRYHQYAKVSEMPVIKQEIIVLKYNIFVSKFSEEELKKLLLLLYSRIYKLNRERINCGIYSRYIQNIKKVSITINFYKKVGDVMPIDISNKNLVIFELNNLNCNRIKPSELQEKCNELIPSILEFCQQEEL